MGHMLYITCHLLNKTLLREHDRMKSFRGGKTYVFVLPILALPTHVLGRDDAPAPAGPDVLFISIDDLSDWIGPLEGHPQTITPNLDRLAAMGMTFTNAHVPAMVCNPSRTAIMTGISPSNSGVYNNASDWRKATLWRESTRVPLIVVAPGVTHPGSRSATTVSLMDLYPTLVELAGMDVPDHVEGVSLVPILRNPSTPSERRAVSTNGFENHAVSGEQYRYLRYSDGSEELYDILSDSHEWKNLAADPAMAAIKAELAEWLPTHNEPDVGRTRD